MTNGHRVVLLFAIPVLWGTVAAFSYLVQWMVGMPAIAMLPVAAALTVLLPKTRDIVDRLTEVEESDSALKRRDEVVS